MEEDLTELKEAIYWADYLKCTVPFHCSYHKPIKLREVNNEDEYKKYIKRDFCGLPVKYERKSYRLRFTRLKPAVSERFVELLPPLTLYHFSKASKQVYYHCLNLRGIEFKRINMYDFPEPFMRLAGYDGTKIGSIKLEVWSNYQILLNSFYVSMDTYLEQPLRTHFVKKYKSLWVYFLDKPFDDNIVHFCDTFIHSGVENVNACVGHNSKSGFFDISLKKFMAFLDYCKHVKQMEFYFSHPEHSVKFMGDPKFPRIKSRVEEWANGAPNLEIFLFSYKENLFQWHEKKLKRVVKHEGKWYWSSKCDIDNVVYKNYEHFEDPFFEKLPFFTENRIISMFWTHASHSIQSLGKQKGKWYRSDECDTDYVV